LKAVAIGGHASIIASPATSHFRPEHQAFHVESGSMPPIRPGAAHAPSVGT
jgi:hypothetical protein